MLGETDYLNIYDLIFETVHSEGFKISEIKDLLFESDYVFLDKPKEEWFQNLEKYLKEKSMIIDDLNMNPIFKKIYTK